MTFHDSTAGMPKQDTIARQLALTLAEVPSTMSLPEAIGEVTGITETLLGVRFDGETLGEALKKRKPPTLALDLDAIAEKWLNMCGSCDYGMPEYGCRCPKEDFRPVMMTLVEEITRLRNIVATIRKATDDV